MPHVGLNFLMSYLGIDLLSGYLISFPSACGRHPDYSHCPEVLEALLEYDREKLWVPEQLIEEGMKSVRERTDYEWVTNEIIQFYLGKRSAVANSRIKKEEE